MKKFLLIALMSLNVQAACLEQNFSIIYDDVETNCGDLAIQSLIDQGCHPDAANHAVAGSPAAGAIQLEVGSAGFCKFELKEGILQIMTDEMNPNPRAAVFFSRWD